MTGRTPSIGTSGGARFLAASLAPTQHTDDPPLEAIRLGGPRTAQAHRIKQPSGFGGLRIRNQDSDALRLQGQLHPARIIARHRRLHPVPLEHARDQFCFNSGADDGNHHTHDRIMSHRRAQSGIEQPIELAPCGHDRRAGATPTRSSGRAISRGHVSITAGRSLVERSPTDCRKRSHLPSRPTLKIMIGLPSRTRPSAWTSDGEASRGIRCKTTSVRESELSRPAPSATGRPAAPGRLVLRMSTPARS